MKKFLALAFGLTWLFAQSACANLRDRGGNYGGGQDHASDQNNSNGENRNYGTNSGGQSNENFSRAQNADSPQRHNRGHNQREYRENSPRAVSPSHSHAASLNRRAYVNRAQAGAYRAKNFSSVRSSSVAVPKRFKSLGLHGVPRPLANRAHYVNSNRFHSSIALPTTGPRGKALSARLLSRTRVGSQMVQQRMASLGSGSVELNRINHYNLTENRPNHYYWHTYNGYRFCHYYDPWGYHWYGWYVGDSCFWTRYYWGNWWWYDSTWARWCYWHDGGWWWNDPSDTNVVYVYVNGDYQPVSTDSDSTSAASPANPAVSSAPLAQKGVYKSPDGSRIVKIFGASNDAFLSDTANPPKMNAVFLGSNAQSVKFAPSSDGGLMIHVTFSDGTIKTFDGQGNLLDGGNNSTADDNT